jgi:hypothetical protein
MMAEGHNEKQWIERDGDEDGEKKRIAGEAV